MKTYKIYPPIGVARIGNHPSEIFIGPELPGQVVKPENGFKVDGKIKRQAARFRVFEFENGALMREIRSNEGTISWKVSLANKKANWKQFDGPADLPLRNGHVPNDKKSGLELKTGPKYIVGNNQKVEFDPCSFTAFENGVSKSVNDIVLGELRTDEEGRLLVIGGHGRSESPFNTAMGSYANNNNWFDDVSDGYVSATVKLNNEENEIAAESAWVLCVPPKFAPVISNIVSLYDTLFNRHVKEQLLSVPSTPSFSNDIYPILNNTDQMKYVHELVGHHSTLQSVLDPNAPDSIRGIVFNMLRKPDGSGGNMPKILGDDYRNGDRLHLTEVQYEIMRKWKDGNYLKEGTDGLPPQTATDITPDNLTKAALENCVGGAFFPGIEASWYLRDTYEFIEPFRLDNNQLEPGDITKQMALPWQADFLACSKESHPDGIIAWWPAARPDDVFPDNGGAQSPWTPQNEFANYQDMVDKWHTLGFIVEDNGKIVEKERNEKPFFASQKTS